MHRKGGDKRLFSILIIVDDFADSPAVSRQSRQSKLLHELYTRGRHVAISSISSVQRYRVLHPAIRVNAMTLIVFRWRNVKELEAIREENSAVVSKDRVRELYDFATSQPYSFMFINTAAKNVNQMFYQNFQRPLEP